MAKFYGTIQGNRGVATKTGSKNMLAAVRSYDGSVITNLYYNDKDELSIRIDIEEDSTSYGQHTYFNGTVDELTTCLTCWRANK